MKEENEWPSAIQVAASQSRHPRTDPPTLSIPFRACPMFCTRSLATDVHVGNHQE
jgi:hypothetical protein